MHQRTVTTTEDTEVEDYRIISRVRKTTSQHLKGLKRCAGRSLRCFHGCRYNEVQTSGILGHDEDDQTLKLSENRLW